MHRSLIRRRARLTLLAGGSAVILAACGDQPLDFDLRGLGGGFSTAEAATGPLARRSRDHLLSQLSGCGRPARRHVG